MDNPLEYLIDFRTLDLNKSNKERYKFFIYIFV